MLKQACCMYIQHMFLRVVMFLVKPLQGWLKRVPTALARMSAVIDCYSMVPNIYGTHFWLINILRKRCCGVGCAYPILY